MVWPWPIGSGVPGYAPHRLQHVLAETLALEVVAGLPDIVLDQAYHGIPAGDEIVLRLQAMERRAGECAEQEPSKPAPR